MILFPPWADMQLGARCFLRKINRWNVSSLCLKTGFSMKIVFLKLKFNHGSHDMIRQGDNAGRFFGGVLFMV